MPNRRQFLAGLCGGLTVATLPRVAMAGGPCRYRILEIFMYGACSHLDTFWVEQGGTSSWRKEPQLTGFGAGIDGATSIDFLDAGQSGLPYDLRVGACFA